MNDGILDYVAPTNPLTHSQHCIPIHISHYVYIEYSRPFVTEHREEAPVDTFRDSLVLTDRLLSDANNVDYFDSELGWPKDRINRIHFGKIYLVN